MNGKFLYVLEANKLAISFILFIKMESNRITENQGTHFIRFFISNDITPIVACSNNDLMIT